MSKFKVHIFYPRVYDFDGGHVTLGGVQTYLLSLAAVLTGEGLDVSIIKFWY
jgi:hypothetical protein